MDDIQSDCRLYDDFCGNGNFLGDFNNSPDFKNPDCPDEMSDYSFPGSGDYSTGTWGRDLFYSILSDYRPAGTCAGAGNALCEDRICNRAWNRMRSIYSKTVLPARILETENTHYKTNQKRLMNINVLC